MVAWTIEALYAVVFLQAVVAYVRRRDPVQRDLMLVFAPFASFLVLEIVRGVFGVTDFPTVVGWAAIALLLHQPYLTLRLVRALRDVPSWMMWAALAACSGSTVALTTFGRRDFAPVVVLAAVVVFFAVQAVAAILLAKESRNRMGAPRTRLLLASLATVMLGVALLAAGVGAAGSSAAGEGSSGGAVAAAVRTATELLALLSAIGYLLAFLPPRWLRRMWSGTAAYTVHRRLMAAPPTEPPVRTWQRYAATVREVSGADAAVVLLPAEGAAVSVASSGELPGAGLVATTSELAALAALPQPVVVPAVGEHPVLSYARAAGARIVVAVPLELPTAARGVLLLLSRHRALFVDDDARLLGELGGQAAILAGRGAARMEQERLAGELAASVQALSAASQAKSDFLANMSHELRTPLNAIIGFSELMRGEPESGESRRSVPAEWIEHVFASGRHLLGLINDILDLAKIEAGRMELRPELVNLPEVVHEVVTTLHPLLDAKRLRLATAVPPIEVRADRTRLRQILDNLLSNAIKFTPEGGHIFVGAAEAGNEVRISVIDTGPGIAAADHERVFEEFRQVGDAEARASGTGLGLALTRRLAQAHGGSVELESEVGDGARFTVTLPNLAPRADESEPAAGDSRPRILLIEDEPSAARLLRTYLEGAGYSVAVAATGEDGVARARRSAPDAVLLDVLLPGIDGWEVLRQLKRDPHLRSVPVFMVTVVDERDVGLSLGATDYFVKPIDRGMLLTRLAERLVPPAPPEHETAVLAIDDDRESLESIESSLRRQGYDVVTASCGRDGLDLARTRPFNLIITDLAMPDIDGFALLGALDSDPATRQVPVLVLTAQDCSEIDKARLNGKILGLLPKGRGTSDILRDWLARHAQPLRAPLDGSAARDPAARDPAARDPATRGSAARGSAVPHAP